MQKVTINGVGYLGKLKEDDNGGFTLKEAMAMEGSATKEIIMDYLKARNNNVLQNVSFGGAGTNYAISDLTAVEEMNLEMCKLGMKQAKSTAVQGLENDTFDTIMGKN